MRLNVHVKSAHPAPDVTDLSGTSSGALPTPARATAFELLLAVMTICKLWTHLMDKHKYQQTQKLIVCFCLSIRYNMSQQNKPSGKRIEKRYR